jgi:AbrB family looped-hinge helix DNA binding protein
LPSLAEELAFMKTVTMSANGRLTLPAETRRKLGLTGETELEIVVIDDERVMLRPVVVVPREDAWAYTAEHRALLAKARADVREGRVRRMSEVELAATDE